MDPEATQLRLVKAFLARDWPEVLTAIDDLKNWIQRGGFAPKIYEGPAAALDALYKARAMVIVLKDGDRLQEMVGQLVHATEPATHA